MKRVILDTHALIWLDADRNKLSPLAQEYLEDWNVQVYVSVVSIVEIVIKHGDGDLELRAPIQTILEEQFQKNPLELLPVRWRHAVALGDLPKPHKDPFDRLLAAQCVCLGATLLTVDKIFKKYPIRTAW